MNVLSCQLHHLVRRRRGSIWVPKSDTFFGLLWGMFLDRLVNCETIMSAGGSSHFIQKVMEFLGFQASAVALMGPFKDLKTSNVKPCMKKVMERGASARQKQFTMFPLVLNELLGFTAIRMRLHIHSVGRIK